MAMEGQEELLFLGLAICDLTQVLHHKFKFQSLN